MKAHKPKPPKRKAQKPENKKPKTPRGALWTTPMRHALCCLFRFFNDNGPGNKDAFEKVFSHMFRSHIIQRRKQDVLPFNTIYAQWAWMRRINNTVWKHAHIDTAFSHEADWKRVIADIKSTATALKIRLVERTHDTTADLSGVKENNQSVNLPEYLESVLLSDTTNDAARASARQEVVTQPYLEQLSNMTINEGTSHSASVTMEFDDDRDDQTDQTPQADSHTSSRLVHSHGKICLWCHMEGEKLVDDDQSPENEIPDFIVNLEDSEPAQEVLQSVEDPMDLTTEEHPGLCRTKDLPPLLYRWSNRESQGTNTPDLYEAELFKNRAELYLPGAISGQTFLEHFTNHVTKAKVKTPFISTFLYPLAPIHRAIHQQKGAIVSVIDPTKVGNPIYKANKLVHITQTATHSWRGHGEFEIWGRVPSEAIVCTFRIAVLEAIQGEIEDFLQLEAIRAHTRCNSVLYSALASNLSLSKRQYYILILKGLGEFLGVPETYRALVAQGFFEAWALRDRFKEQCDGHRGIDDGLTLLTTTDLASGSDSDNTFHPQPSGSESSLGSTSSEDAESSSETVVVRIPRRDTPSDGFSVDDDSSVGSGKRAMGRAATQTRPQRPVNGPYTPPPSGYSRQKQDTILRGVGSIQLKPFAHRETPTRTPGVDSEDEWPSDNGSIDTPVRSRFFPLGEEI